MMIMMIDGVDNDNADDDGNVDVMIDGVHFDLIIYGDYDDYDGSSDYDDNCDDDDAHDDYDDGDKDGDEDFVYEKRQYLRTDIVFVDCLRFVLCI